ncbi:MAG TPA: hypothetical protein VEC16_07215 [Alphaproteobacteria bacterium]|nr:hypothetical protein [Alphaproteobacteria bacterium]
MNNKQTITLDDKIAQINELVTGAFGRKFLGNYDLEETRNGLKWNEINALKNIARERKIFSWTYSLNVAGQFKNQDGSEIEIHESYEYEAKKYSQFYEQKYGKPANIKLIFNQFDTTIDMVNHLVGKVFGPDVTADNDTIFDEHWYMNSNREFTRIKSDYPKEIRKENSFVKAKIGEFTEEDGSGLIVKENYLEEAQKYAELYAKRTGKKVTIKTYTKGYSILDDPDYSY